MNSIGVVLYAAPHFTLSANPGTVIFISQVQNCSTVIIGKWFHVTQTIVLDYLISTMPPLTASLFFTFFEIGWFYVKE